MFIPWRITVGATLNALSYTSAKANPRTSGRVESDYVIEASTYTVRSIHRKIGQSERKTAWTLHI